MHLLKIDKLCLLLIIVMENLEISITSTLLQNFHFNLDRNNSCYRIYNSTENINALTCKTVQKGKRSCVTDLGNDSQYCSIRTPSNESIVVPCTSTEDTTNSDFYGYEENDPCILVFKQDVVKEVCVKLIDGVGAVITTPDNYTIIIGSSDCDSEKKRTEIKADKNFVINFQFDPEDNFCYQIYPKDYDLSLVYSCSDNTILKSCLEYWDKNKNCTVIKSLQNEVVIIECDGREKPQNKCLDVYTGDIKSEVCLEELEEGCVGFILPSGLKMLVACRKCIQSESLQPYEFYDKEVVKRRSNFFKYFFQNEKKYKNSYFKNKFEILGNKTRETVYPYWLSNTCYGLTLPTNETVVLQCTDKIFDTPGCFLLTTSNVTNEKEICANVGFKGCVNLETPQGINIILSCSDEVNVKKQNYLDNLLAQFNNGSYDLSKSDFTKRVYREDNYKMKQDYQIKWLYNYKCHGLVTEDLETILLSCPNDKNESKNGCFKIYTQKYGPGNKIVDSSQEENEACVKIINDDCVGIITSKGWCIELVCYHDTTNIPIVKVGVINPVTFEPDEMI